MTPALHRTGDIRTGDIRTGDIDTGDIRTGDIDTGKTDPADLARSLAEAGRRSGPLPRRRASVRPGGSTRAPRGPGAGEPTGPDAIPGAPRSGHLVTIAGGRAGGPDLSPGRGSAALATSVYSGDVGRGRIAPVRLGLVRLGAVRLAPVRLSPVRLGPVRLGSAARVVPSPSRAGAPAPPATLRLTVRARRLIAALVLLCAAGVGVVAVDLLADVLPHAAAAGATTADAGSAAATGPGAVPGGPGTLVSGQTLTVAAGDTLWGIAADLDAAADPRELVAEIMTLNGLTAPDLTTGQVLLLP